MTPRAAGTAEQALRYAAHGWPVFPCQPGSKQPATTHGFLDATTDPDKVTWWWRRQPDANLAIATGHPGPDVLDVDQHGPAGNGYAAFNKLQRAGLIDAASAIVATPSGGLHAYFTGSDQRCGKLTGHHLDFRGHGGYVLAPPSQVDGRAYQVIRHRDACGGLDWAKVTSLLQPQRSAGVRPAPVRRGNLSHLAAWVQEQQEGNRNDGLFWAACRAAEAGDEMVLAEVADAARATGLPDREIAATIASARRAAGRPFEHQGGRDGRVMTGPSGRIDANGTMWRLRSLVAMGHDSARIARALDVSPVLVRRVVRGQARTITAEFHAAACQLWDAWWDKTPLARTPAQRAAAARALRQAARRDWPAAAGLEEDLLDSPGYRPWCRYRSATGTGTAPDFPPSRPRLLHADERIA